MATFTFHNYIQRNDSAYMIFIIVQQHNYISREEKENSRFSHDNIRQSRHEMREIRDNIATMIWNARHFT